MAKIEDFYHAPAEERANPRQRECPDCGALLVRRTSERMSPLYQEINYQCQNFFCASTFKGYEEIVYRLKVPMQPNPLVTLPISPSQRYAEPLAEINLVPVESPEGQAVGVSINEPLAGRTNTSAGPRKPRNVINLAGLDVYTCEKTEFDVALPYPMMDGWAKFPDFQERIDRAIGKRQALDRLMIGFNGTHAAAATDREAYPLLQDVNIGWLEKIRTKAPAQVTSSGATVGKVTIGLTGDYRSLDALVFALIQKLAPHHRKRPDLVVLVDRDLLHTKLLANVADATDNASELALNRILASGQIAGIPHRDAPSFPDATVLVTSLSNLSIYYQKSSLRRFIRDEPMINQVEDFQSLNEAYVVEDFELVALAENIEFV